jgi:hypothetical protein
MNKRKKVAIMKHRHKKKRAELRRKGLILASGGTIKPMIKVAPKKEKEMPKPVKALADMLKPKEASQIKKATPPKKEKASVEKKIVETAESTEKVKKPLVRKKKSETVEPSPAKKEPKKTAARKKKPDSSGD